MQDSNAEAYAPAGDETVGKIYVITVAYSLRTNLIRHQSEVPNKDRKPHPWNAKLSSSSLLHFLFTEDLELLGLE